MFYGLGDKATQMNLKGKRLENFATDQYAFQKDQEPLYKVVPLYCYKTNKPMVFSSTIHLEL
jgi:alpha-glucosidase